MARKVGFEFVEERMVPSTYTGVPDGMLEHVYNCAFWVARKIPAARAVPGDESEALGETE
jgi:carnosine N-methyltransferase